MGGLSATGLGETVVCTALRAVAPLASLTNGVSAHVLDYGHTNFVVICHTSGL